MKIRYPVIISIALLITLVIINGSYMVINLRFRDMLNDILCILFLVCLGLIAYLIIRNIIRAIKGAVTGVPQGDGYRDEARRACEKVTPKRKQDITPPWEK